MTDDYEFLRPTSPERMVWRLIVLFAVVVNIIFDPVMYAFLEPTQRPTWMIFLVSNSQNLTFLRTIEACLRVCVRLLATHRIFLSLRMLLSVYPFNVAPQTFLVDAIFTLDVLGRGSIFSFIHNGEIVSDPIEILKRYRRSTNIFFDLLGVVPISLLVYLGLIPTNGVTELLGVLSRVMRSVRLPNFYL